MTTSMTQQERRKGMQEEDDDTTSTTAIEEFRSAPEDDITAISINEEDSFASVSTTSSSSSSRKSKKSSKKGKKRRKKAKKRLSKKGRTGGDKKKVSFGTTEILEFNYTIAHQSVTEKGVPIGLGDKLLNSKTISVSKFEKRRKERDGDLSPQTRRRLLLREGFSSEDILEANQTSMLVRISRKQSVLNMKWDDWNAKKEKVGRGVRKWTNPKTLYKKSTQILQRQPTATAIPVQ